MGPFLFHLQIIYLQSKIKPMLQTAKKNHLIVLLTIFLFGCATKYRPVNPQQLSYGTKAEKSEVELYYKYDVLAEANNVKYVNKELRRDVKLVAVKIYNNTTQQITIGENAKFYGDDKEIMLLGTDALRRELRQGLPAYMAYLVMAPLKYSFEKDNGRKTVDVFYGAAAGGTLAAVNMYKAGKANSKLKKELEKNSLFNKTVLPGETVYGLIGLKGTGYVPLVLKLVK
jgi:hypothetical protein